MEGGECRLAARVWVWSAWGDRGLRSPSGASQVDDEDESRSRDAGRTHEASAAKDIEATPQGRGRGRRAEVQCRLRSGACTSYAPRGKGMW